MLNLVNVLVILRRLPPLSELTGEEERALFELRTILKDDPSAMPAQLPEPIQARLLSLRNKGLIAFDLAHNANFGPNIAFTPAAEDLFAALK